MGPASLEKNVDMIVESLEKFLMNQSFCQTSKKVQDDEEIEEEDELVEDSEEDSEEIDHDEIILSNTTDYIIAISAALGDNFLPYFKRLGPIIVEYIKDDNTLGEKLMAIGCLTEIFNSCPSAVAPPFFEPFM